MGRNNNQVPNGGRIGDSGGGDGGGWCGCCGWCGLISEDGNYVAIHD